MKKAVRSISKPKAPKQTAKKARKKIVKRAKKSMTKKASQTKAGSKAEKLNRGGNDG